MDAQPGHGAVPARQQPMQRARRPRAARACDNCRAKKFRCDEKWPCTGCKSRNIHCQFQGQDLSRVHLQISPDYVQQLEAKVKELTRQVHVFEEGASAHTGPPNHPSTSPDYHEDDTTTLQNQDDNDDSMAIDGETRDHPSAADTASPWTSRSQEVLGVNLHTRDEEFYGSSSTIALLAHAQSSGDPGSRKEHSDKLVTELHNPNAGSPQEPNTPATRPRRTDGQVRNTADRPHNQGWFPQCRRFLDTFFATIHYIHPFLDKDDFMQRCRTLWATPPTRENCSTFAALYFSVLSLGALVSTRRDDLVDDCDDITWSKYFFDRAIDCHHQLGMSTDLEMAQCLFILAKVCQNRLHPHKAYMYIGLAVRTALAIGINRDPGDKTSTPPAILKAQSRTWWSLYSLETEMSFAMGRPDTLGSDLYHNRQYPLSRASQAEPRESMLEPPLCDIIKCMVDLSRITRTICLNIYVSDISLQRAVHIAQQIEKDLDAWQDDLPDAIQPPSAKSRPSLRGSRDLPWMKRQRLVLTLRSYNLRLLLFGSFLLRSTPQDRVAIQDTREAVAKCLDSSKRTIDLIYQTYEHSEFFRTWFYNTTYTVFAASLLLIYLGQDPIPDEVEDLLHYVEKAIDILLMMDECVVALQAAALLRQAIGKIRNQTPQAGSDPLISEHLPLDVDRALYMNPVWSLLTLDGYAIDPNVAFPLRDFNEAGIFPEGPN